MNRVENKWRDPHYIFPTEHFDGLVEIFKDAIGDKKGHIGFGRPKFRFLDVHYTVYEKDELNHMTKQELKEYYDRMIEESGNEMYGETVLSEYNSHMSFEVGWEDDCLHLISINLFTKGKGIGTDMVAWLENYAKEQGFKGVVIRSTESEAMNHIAVKRGYVPVYTTIEERIEFGKKQGFRYDPNAEIEYDANGHLFGYYQLTF